MCGVALVLEAWHTAAYGTSVAQDAYTSRLGFAFIGDAVVCALFITSHARKRMVLRRFSDHRMVQVMRDGGVY